DRRRPPTNGMLDQASEPAFAYKRAGVVLTATVDENDLRRRRSQDSEYAKQARGDGGLVQDGDDDRDVIIRSGRIVSHVVPALRLHARPFRSGIEDRGPTCTYRTMAATARDLH